MHVAITGVGGGIGQSVIRALRRSSVPTGLIGLDANAWSAGLYQCDAHVVIPPVAEGEAYVDALEGVIRDYDIDALIPGTDTELYAIARARERFADLGCRAISSTPDFVRMARNKLATCAAFISRGVAFARTITWREMVRSAESMSFPVIVKPKDGSGSTGVKVLFDTESMRYHQFSDEDVVQEYLVPKSWRVPEAHRFDVMKQGRLRQEDEVSVQGLVAADGSLVGIYASINELRDGVPMRISPTLDPEVLDSARKVFAVCADMGHIGPCNLQGRMTDNGLVLYEVNPRFTGITAVRAATGFNECEAALRLFVDRETPEAVARLLRCDSETVCVRYITEELVARSAVEP
jgi:carbamoylphosphate synthase large subunit